MCIYKLSNLINGKSYIGLTTQNPNTRFLRHKHNAKIGVDTPLYHAMRKYGVENFTMEIIDGANSLDELCYREVFHMYKENSLSPNGYNLRIKTHHHVTTRDKQSQSLKNNKENTERLKKVAVEYAKKRIVPVRAINAHTGEIKDFSNINDVGILGTHPKHVQAMINGRKPYKKCKGWLFEHIGKETKKMPQKQPNRRSQIKRICKSSGEVKIYEHLKCISEDGFIPSTVGAYLQNRTQNNTPYSWEYY